MDNPIDKIEVELKLTVAQANLILTHLAKGIYADVADIIQHMHKQVIPQVNAAQAPKVVAGSDSNDPTPMVEAVPIVQAE